MCFQLIFQYLGFGETNNVQSTTKQGYQRPGIELYEENTLTQVDGESDEETGKVHVDESSSDENSQDSSISDDHEMTEPSEQDEYLDTNEQAADMDLIQIETIRKPTKPKFQSKAKENFLKQGKKLLQKRKLKTKKPAVSNIK